MVSQDIYIVSRFEAQRSNEKKELRELKHTLEPQFVLTDRFYLDLSRKYVR